MSKRPSLRTTIFKGLLGSGASAMASCTYCAITDLETTPFGLIASLFVVPSIALFLLLERRGSTPQPKCLGFLVPARLVGLLTACQLTALQDGRGYSDGSHDMLMYFAEAYVAGLIGAAVLPILAKSPSDSTDRRKHQDSMSSSSS